MSAPGAAPTERPRVRFAALGEAALAPTAVKLRPLYSRYVGWMKIVLPLTAAALIGLVVAWPDPAPQTPSFGFSFTSLETGEGAELGMNKARYIGTDEDQQSYVITADSVRPVADRPDVMTLEFLQADMTMIGGQWITLMAPTGLFDRAAEELVLPADVDIYSDDGFEMHTRGARLDLATGTVMGDQPVQANGPLGQLSADGFRFVREGQRFIFTGRVKLTVRPGTAP